MDALQNSAFIKILKETFIFHNLRQKKKNQTKPMPNI
jgi:hypothetical protein